ncbi:hypothetical protein C9374_013891 [Naegleria lovaniensis]|uniref:Helicase n=1 Tax=Naegleria lovaniensis TaxID=51637 RepID=A0AA88H0B4_NAELO|nr:uncharacterized protein C9374_013891 [Naegleria lovaniensis]KAG2389331.1 hypothetical protein C9374_013891 [Naegleria lovaniensis]
MAKDDFLISEYDDDENQMKPRVSDGSDDGASSEFSASDQEDGGESDVSLMDSSSEEELSKKKRKKKHQLKELKLKNKTLDFTLFMSRITNLKIDYQCFNDLKLSQNNPAPKYMLNSCKLKNHQWEGVSWLKSLLIDHETSGILGDDMGLGKTVQVIAFIAYVMELMDTSSSVERKPFLIVTPLSLIENWCLEFKKFCGDNIKILRYIGNQEERSKLQSNVEGDFENSGNVPFDVVVTSYEMILNDEHFLGRFNYKLLCVDEAHRLKSPKSQLYKMLQQVYKWERAILMSGTPLMNSMHELWALLRFAAPQFFDHDYDTFERWFPQQCFLSKSRLKKSVSATQPSLEDADEVMSVDADQVRKNFQFMLKPFLLRRTKNQVLKDDLPPKKEHIIYTRLTSMQKKYYKSFLLKDRQTIGKKNVKGLNNILMSLRKCCNHPYLFEGAEPEPFVEGEHIVNNSGKMIILDKLLKKLKKEGHRVLIFSQMTSMLDILQDYFHYRKWNYERLDGSVRGEERFNAIANFSDNNVFAFLLSTRAGGVGLNLVSADTVIFTDMDMNPQLDFQAQSRCHRIGQDKPVSVYRLVTENTVEEVILRRSMKKITLSVNTVDTAAAASNSFESNSDDKLSTDTILEILTFGLHKIMNSSSTTEDDHDTDQALLELSIDDILDEKSSLHSSGRLSLTLDEAAESFKENAESNSESIYMYEGVDYQQKPSKISYKEPQQNEKDIEVLKNILEEVGLDLSQTIPAQTNRGKNAAKKRKKEVLSSSSSSEDDNLLYSYSSGKDDEKSTPISRRTRSATKTSRKKRKVKKEDDESDYDAYDPHTITIPEDWDLELYLMEQEFNQEDEEPSTPTLNADNNQIQYVKGDVTSPEKYESSGARFIINCISDFGQYPTAGISKQIITKYSDKPKVIYENAIEQGEISLGDAQLIPLKKSNHASTHVVNVIAQHYEKSKGHGPLLTNALEVALHKVAYSAITMKATVHMPRIGFGLQGFDWYSTERILKKCLLKAGIKTFVYYFDRNASSSTIKSSIMTPVKHVATPTTKRTPVKQNSPPPQQQPQPVANKVDTKDDPLESLNIYLYGVENKNDKKLKRLITINGGIITNSISNLDMIIVSHPFSLATNDNSVVKDDEIEDQETVQLKEYLKQHPLCQVVTSSDIMTMIQ